MEFKGTKGKWRVNNESFTKVHTLETSEIYTQRSTHDGEWIGYIRGENSEIREANAKLIAAAPELLETLIDLVIHAQENDLHSEFTENANKAINKALN